MNCPYKSVLLRLHKASFKIISKLYLNTDAALDGVRVLDLTRVVAGPYCTMILGDLGAEIIKIERPGTGDDCRKWGPPFIGNDSKQSAYFTSVNRNKKSVCVDLKSADGRDVIYNLAKKCDVLVENYIPGNLDKLCLGYEDMKKIAPHLIYCSVTGYGSEGPYRDRPGYDVIAASVGGLLHLTGPTDGEPVKAGVPVTDLATGLYAHGAILAALIQRGKTGLGQKIDCNLLSTQVASLIYIGSNYLHSGEEPKRLGTAHVSIVPHQAFQTSDGYYTIGTGSDAHFADFCQRINRPDLLNNPKFSTNAIRSQNRSELLSIIKPILRSRTNREWIDILKGSQCPNGPINSLEQVFDDEHVKAIRLLKEIEHPKVGKMKVVGPPVKYSYSRNEVRLPPPVLGEHTREILQNVLAYSTEKIDKLYKANVIQ